MKLYMALAAALLISAPVFAEEDDQPAPIEATASAPVTAPAPEMRAAYGTLNAAKGGLPSTLWAHADGKAVVHLLSLLPETVLSPATHELLRRALLTNAPGPANVPEIEFVKARVTALLKIGDAADAGSLVRTIPPASNEPLARAVVEGEFYAAENEMACLDVRSFASKYSEDFWKRALVVCQLQAGQRTAATAGIAGLPASADDPDFTTLAQAIGNGQRPDGTAAKPTALDAALLRMGHAMPSPELLHDDDPLIMAGIARGDSAPSSTRVEAAYVAAEQGGFGIYQTLAALRLPGASQPAATDMTVVRDDLTGSMAEAAHRDAALVASADEAKDGPQKNQILRQMMLVGADAVDVPFLARVEYIRALSVSGDRSRVAVPVARGFMLEGDVPSAQRWYELAQKIGNAAELDRIYPLAHVAFANPGDTAPSPALQRWAERTLASDQDTGPKRVERVLAAVSGLGEQVPPSLWMSAVGKPDDEDSIMGSMGINAALSDAVKQDSLGEVIVLVALSLKDGPGHAHPMNLNHAVGALSHVGLLNPAKAVALEGLAPVTALSKE